MKNQQADYPFDIAEQNRRWLYQQLLGWKRRAGEAEKKLFKAQNSEEYFKIELKNERRI